MKFEKSPPWLVELFGDARRCRRTEQVGVARRDIRVIPAAEKQTGEEAGLAEDAYAGQEARPGLASGVRAPRRAPA